MVLFTWFDWWWSQSHTYYWIEHLYHLFDFAQNIYLYHRDLAYKNPQNYAFYTAFLFFSFVFFLYTMNRLRSKMAINILPDPTKPRFRKRDKVLFFGRKMLRKVRSSIQGTGRLRGKKRQMVLKFAKRLLRLKRDLPLELKVKEPSQAFLEEEVFDSSENQFPEEVVYMIKNIRVFGFFEKPLFLKLCQSMEFINVSKGQFLFNIGDPDDSIYIVQSGEIQVTLTEPDGSILVLKNVHVGESIASMLSVMDVLTGFVSKFKTISATAIEDSVILRLKIEVLKQLIDSYPEMLIRVVQVIMVRLQRVTFISLHKYLGLTTQLINLDFQNRRIIAGINQQIGPLNTPSKSSPIHSNTKSHARSYSTADAIDLKAILKLDAELTPNNSTQTNNNVEPKPRPIVNEQIEMDRFKMRRRRSFMSEDRTTGLSNDELITLAVSDLKQILKMDDDKLLYKHVTIKEFKKDICLASEESGDENNLLFLISGSFMVTQKSSDTNEDSNLFLIFPGELIGALGVLSGEEPIFTVRTRQQCKVAIISKEGIYDIMREHPEVSLHLAHTVIQRLSPFVRQIDFALDWIHYESGRAIYRAGEKSDCTYIVLSGRLRSVATLPSGKRELVGEYGKGDLVGIVEVITHTQRSSTVMAVRDSELAKLPDGLLEAIKVKYPVVVTRLIHLLGHRLLVGNIHSSNVKISTEMGSRPTGSNFSTVALLSVTDDVPLHAFAYELYHALTAIGSVTLLTSEIVKKTLGQSALDRQSEYRLCSWLGIEEDKHKIVLYQCDKGFSAWTQRCIRQADCILIVGLGEHEPTVGYVEKQLEHLSIRTQKELILLHRIDGPRPKNTVHWLNMRDWCSSNHHIRCPKRVFLKRLPSKIQEYYSNVITSSPPNIHSDFSRLARFLTGTSIGLVLGGGGARGAAHVGMIKSITEVGLPIDMVGGVSIGAFMGALWCQENNLTTFIQKAHSWSMGMTSYWRQILDLTYPSTAMFTGSAFNRSIYEVFGEIQIEDLWLPYFTVTTDITSSCPRIHTHGSLWRYVRSSMSLSGYLPPLCDPIDGHLLLDGGYVNNLPADIMHDVMGVETILAIDVGSQDESDLTNYGDQLSGWWLLWKRWNPFTVPIRVPNLPEIQSRLAYVSCVKQLEEVKNSDYCTYIRPPIDGYKTLQFKSFNEIMNVGYHHGKVVFNTMQYGEQKSLFNYLQKDKTRKISAVDSNKVLGSIFPAPPRQASFTDLAERVCKIKKPQVTFKEFEDISEDDLEYTSEPEMHGFGTDTDTEILSAYVKSARKSSTLF